MARTLAAPERELGVTLLNRTTRHIDFTDPGRQYVVRCRTILWHVQEADAVLHSRRAALHGKLAVTASVLSGARYVAPLIKHSGDELRLIVHGDRSRHRTIRRQSLQGLHDALSREREIGLQWQPLATLFVDAGQHAELAAVKQLILREIHRPALAHRLCRRPSMQDEVGLPAPALAVRELSPVFGIGWPGKSASWPAIGAPSTMVDVPTRWH